MIVNCFVFWFVAPVIVKKIFTAEKNYNIPDKSYCNIYYKNKLSTIFLRVFKKIRSKIKRFWELKIIMKIYSVLFFENLNKIFSITKKEE